MTVRKQKGIHTKSLIAVGALALALAMLVPATTAVAESGDLSRARVGTASYHEIEAARAAGYGLFPDAAGIACIDNPGVGGMGVHYVKSELVDSGINAATPEALVYESQSNGRLRLVAVEYVVLQEVWEDAGNTAPPSLFGQPFELIESGNRYDLPPFYELHAWIWKHNPSGMFNDWNPRVSCAEA